MKRKGNIFIKLILAFTIIPLVELFLLFQIATMTNWLLTFALVIVTGLIGAYLAKREGRGVLHRIGDSMKEGRVPSEELINGLCIIIGGAFLLTPGIITDIVGFSLIIPNTRSYYRSLIKKKVKGMIEKGNIRIYS